MVEKRKYSLDGMEMRSRVRGYNSRPISDIRARAPQARPKPNTAQPVSVKHVEQKPVQKTQDFVLVEQAPANAPSVHLKQRKNLKAYSLVIAAFSMLIIGGYLTVQGVLNNQQVAVQAKALAQGVENSEDGKPDDNGNYDETPPGNLSTYFVSPDLPRLISIPDVGVYARIKRVGTDANNNVNAPKNVFDVGWYEGSSKPGQPGVMFLDGHVSGPTKGGIFANLKKISIGDTITIERGDLKKFKYKVMAKEVYDANKVDMAKVLKPYNATKQGLNIMTCNGKFNAKTQTFDKRIIIYAVAE